MKSTAPAPTIKSYVVPGRVAPTLFGVFLLFTLAAVSQLHAQARYILQDLGTLPGNFENSNGNGITASGQVVGVSSVTNGSHAFLTATDGQTLNDLGLFAGGLNYSSGNAVSPDGQVVGRATHSSGNDHAFWRAANGGALVDLGTLPGRDTSEANGVNNSGQVVGISSHSVGPGIPRAFVSAPGAGLLTDIGTLGGDISFAYGINSSGRITGQSEISPGGVRHAFLTDSNGSNMKDLGVLPFGQTTIGLGVNDAGQVVGNGNTSGGFNHAFVSDVDGGALTDIGYLPGGFEQSVARGINNFSVIVGHGATVSDGNRAFIYTTVTGMVDLNNLIDPSSGFILVSATDINDRGQISGFGSYSVFGPEHAFRLTPGIPDSNRLGVTFSGGSASAGPGGSFTFQALASIKLTHLAVMDTSSNGLASPMNVTLTGPNNQVLASATIPAGTTALLVNGFRYVPLSNPLLIPAGPDVYTISSSGSEPVVTNATSITPGPDISTAGGTLGPNFLYTRQPLSNVDFEIGPFMDPGTVAGWTVIGAVAATEEGATSAFHGAAFSAGVDSEGNMLLQSFFTTANLRYTLEFDSGVFGQRSSAPLQLKAQVSGNGTVLDQTVTPPDAMTFDPAAVSFQHYQFDFVANAAISTLALKDIGLGNLAADVILDKTLITAAPPSYSTWQALYFDDNQRNDLTVSGPLADPDKDGLPNGFEFYFNFNPVTGMTAAERLGLPQFSVQTINSTATLMYRRRIGSGGVIGFSNNLQIWDERDSIQPGGTSMPTGDNITETFTAVTPATSPNFFRLSLGQTHRPSASQWRASAGGNNHWYEVVKVPVRTWRQARDYAVDHGGYLATITSSAENDFVKSLAGYATSPFIGGYRENNVWHWVTGEPFSYTNWDAGEPNNFGGVEDCLQFLGASGKWTDTSKDNTNAIVVEYPN